MTIMNPGQPEMNAAFLGERGSRFMTVSFRPARECRGHIFFIPPFGEEMNRCRALVADQARRFSGLGYACTILDFYGTGDSDGELYEATLDIWNANIRTAIERCVQDNNIPIILWGLRLGALIAMDFSNRSEVPLHDLVLWQPVTSGKRYVTQILRQRVAALVGRQQKAETTQEIRQRIEDGEHVEISGYTVGRALIKDIEALEPVSLGKLCSGTIYWLENVSDSGQEISVASNKIVTALQNSGNKLEVAFFADPPMWQLHKRDNAPELLDITTDFFR